MVGPLHSAPQRRLRLACGWCKRQSLRSKACVCDASVLLDASSAALLLFDELEEQTRPRGHAHDIAFAALRQRRHRRRAVNRRRDTTGELPAPQLRARETMTFSEAERDHQRARELRSKEDGSQSKRAKRAAKQQKKSDKKGGKTRRQAPQARQEEAEGGARTPSVVVVERVGGRR